MRHRRKTSTSQKVEGFAGQVFVKLHSAESRLATYFNPVSVHPYNLKLSLETSLSEGSRNHSCATEKFDEVECLQAS